MHIPFTENPEQALVEWLGQRPSAFDVLWLRYQFIQYYLDGAPPIELLALFQLDGERLWFTVGEATEATEATEGLAAGMSRQPGGPSLREFCAEHKWPLLVMDQPLRLEPVAIPKPWGREIWFTGIEQRGLSRVTDGVASAPLPWVLSVAPGRLCAGLQRRINLLKILDPLPEEVYGDLYFELHEEKHEVYVVTHVDRGAWPDGVGRIRFGFDPRIRGGYDSDGAFKADYLAAVRRYEQVRREIDGLLDQSRRDEGVATNAPVPVAQLKRWHARLPAALCEREEALRQQMNAFTALLPLQPGDVVKVPLLTPHALQHGVRTVEFQTPVYERRILSFAQKVLTQDHWDTEQAVAQMSLQPALLPELKTLHENDAYRLEEVVCFDDFRVERLTLFAATAPGYPLPETGCYALLMTVAGEIELPGISLGCEQALLVPAQRGALQLRNAAASPATVLIARPI
ncbi:hypothetical protein [Porticoccus sp.]